MSFLPISETTTSRLPSSSGYPGMPADKELSRPRPRAGSALFRVKSHPRLIQFVLFTPSLKICRESMGGQIWVTNFGSSEAFSWVTVGHGKLRAATNGRMDIIFQGRWGRENSEKPSPSKLEQRHEKFLRSSSRKLMLFGLVVAVAKEAIATRVLIARAGRNESAFGKYLGHRERERLDLAERGSHPRRLRSYKSWTSAVLAFPVPPRAAAL